MHLHVKLFIQTVLYYIFNIPKYLLYVQINNTKGRQAWFLEIALVRALVCVCVRACVCMCLCLCVCASAPRPLITSGVIWCDIVLLLITSYSTCR